MGQGKAVLVDITRCVGCESCSVACRLFNELPPEKQGAQKHELIAGQWTVIQSHTVNFKGGRVRRFVKNQCLHCLEPACASACFARALQKTPEGPVVYNASLCVGCRYCMLACPFDIPKYEWNQVFPKISKCQMCLSRVAKNEMPACVSVCPTGALTFGTREDMLKEAHKRIAKSPDLYTNYVYGEKEAGGTSWLYLSDVPFQQLGFNTGVVKKPLPGYTERVLRLTPGVAVGWGALLTGMYLYNHRRSAVEKEENS